MSDYPKIYWRKEWEDDFYIYPASWSVYGGSKDLHEEAWEFVRQKNLGIPAIIRKRDELPANE